MAFAADATRGAAPLPLQWLVGTWRGTGRGHYPTIQGFEYGEEVRFWRVGGKPFLAYTQRTWTAEAPHKPMHTECGYVRPQPHHRAEFLVCDPTGIAQVYEGTADPERHALEVSSTAVARTSSAKEVTQLRRVYRLRAPAEGASPSDIGVRLGYEVEMAAMGQPLQQHLVGELEKLQEEEEEELQLGQISPDALKEQLDAYTVVDVREREEYEREHVAGAINLPLGRLLSMAATDLAGLLALLPRQQVVVYCRQGYRGALAQKELHPLGVSRIVYNLQGGWEGWNAAA